MSSSSSNRKAKRQRRAKKPVANNNNKLPPEIQTKLCEAWEGAQKKTKKGEERERIPLHRAVQIMNDVLDIEVAERDISSNEQDEVDRDIFFAVASRKLVQKDKAARAFSLFDTGEKGVVVLEDIQRMAEELEISLTEEELQEMIDEVDSSGDGLLTLDDFVKIAKKVNL